MKNEIKKMADGGPKYFAGFVGTLIFRLLSPVFGLWNISPLMATELASAKAYGPWLGGIYGALSIALVDIIMGKTGLWTIITSLTYGAVGVFGAYFLMNKNANARNFVVASVIGTLFFDFITGILMGPLMFDQPWGDAFFGQIPFTLRHLLGNIFFAVVLAPWFYRKIMTNPSLSFSQIFKFA